MPEPAEILTIGHSTHEAEFFVSLLRKASAEAVADVRRFPGSRRNPQFGADTLATSLSAGGIAYESLGAELGGRRRAVPAPTNAGWRVAGFRAYADHMASPEFEAGLARLEELARERRTAVMCAEGDWRRCHRRLIADALLARRWRVTHLLPGGGREEYRLTDFAVVHGGRVSYPPPQPTLETT